MTAGELLAMAESTLTTLTLCKQTAYQRISEAEALAVQKDEAARAALMAGKEISPAMLGNIGAARQAAEFYRRAHKSLDLDIAAARVTLAIATHEAAVADAALAAAELDAHQQRITRSLRQTAEMEGGEIAFTLEGGVSTELRERINHYSNVADTAAAQIVRRKAELEILQEQRRGAARGL